MYRKDYSSSRGVPQDYRGWAASPCATSPNTPATPSPSPSTPSSCNLRDALLLGAVILVLLPRD